MESIEPAIDLAPDWDHITRFVNTMFRNADPGRLHLRAFDDAKGGTGGLLAAKGVEYSPRDSASLEHLLDQIENMVQLVPGCCFAPPVCMFWARRTTATEADVTAAVCLMVDLDQRPEAGLKHVTSLLGPATLVVRSGGMWQGEHKLHVYYRLTEPASGPAELAEHKRCLAVLSQLVGGDPTAKSCVHPMRWPGTAHAKDPGDIRRCEIVGGDPDVEITLAHASSRLVSTPAAASVPSAGKRAEGRSTGELVRQMLTGDELHGTMVPLAMRLTRRSLDELETVDFLRALLESADCPRDVRWQARMGDVQRTVATAIAKNAQMPVEESPQWTEHLHDRTAKGGPWKMTSRNLDTVLKECPQVTALVAFNERTGQMELSRKAPWGGRAGDVVQAEFAQQMQAWLEWNGFTASGSCSSVEALYRKLYSHSQARAYDPVLRHLRSLKWDGTPRLDHWLRLYARAPVNDNQGIEYLSLVGRWWLISAVARAFAPGCEAHHVLVLEGRQGAGKSTLFRVLGMGFAGALLADLAHNPRAAQEIVQRQWITELDELAAVRRADTLARLKAFLTSPVDEYRAPYARQPVSRPRRGVFGGSVNPDGFGYLNDSTGARRFWPVLVGDVDLAALRRDAEQLWAEAVVGYRLGMRWYPPEEDIEVRSLFAARTAEAQEHDPMVDTLAKWLDGRSSVLLSEIMDECLLVPAAKALTVRNRVGRCLSELGYKCVRARFNGLRQRVWMRHTDTVDL